MMTGQVTKVLLNGQESSEFMVGMTAIFLKTNGKHHICCPK